MDKEYLVLIKNPYSRISYDLIFLNGEEIKLYKKIWPDKSVGMRVFEAKEIKPSQDK